MGQGMQFTSVEPCKMKNLAADLPGVALFLSGGCARLQSHRPCTGYQHRQFSLLPEQRLLLCMLKWDLRPMRNLPNLLQILEPLAIPPDIYNQRLACLLAALWMIQIVPDLFAFLQDLWRIKLKSKEDRSLIQSVSGRAKHWVGKPIIRFRSFCWKVAELPASHFSR